MKKTKKLTHQQTTLLINAARLSAAKATAIRQGERAKATSLGKAAKRLRKKAKSS